MSPLWSVFKIEIGTKVYSFVLKIVSGTIQQTQHLKHHYVTICHTYTHFIVLTS